jgi:hypothetical protein
MKLLATFVIALALGHSADALDKPAHLFILTGQSNMQGMDPKAGFVPEAQKLFPDCEVVYLKLAKGGQPIRLWVEEWNRIAEKHDLTPRIESTKYYKPILAQYAKLLGAHPEPASVTFCWMQGERDAKEDLSAAYAEALEQLVANLRRDLEQPEMNIVIGRLSDHKKDTDRSWAAVRKAQIDVASEDPHGAWVDCDDLNNKEKNGVQSDDLHYTKEGYALLGRRFARQAKALIDKKTPAADGRPG